MNKKDFWTLIGCNLTTGILLIEHLCGLDKALECMIFWTIISMLIHIHILKDYIRLAVEIREV